ncbi:MAG: hypothetical protein HY319_22955 [Armatimonadetes bacterium]|nr:hypothetical protein [Armatimonadota bacterium]
MRWVVLFLTLLTCGCAEEPRPYKLFVRHQPFGGRVTGEGTNLQVELKPFAQAFGAPVAQQGEAWTLEGQPIETRTTPDGAVLVSLKIATEKLGARLDIDYRLTSVDVLAPGESAPKRDPYVLVSFEAPT